MKRYLVVVERQVTETAHLFTTAESPEAAAAEALEYPEELHWSAPGIPEEEIPVTLSSVTEAPL